MAFWYLKVQFCMLPYYTTSTACLCNKVFFYMRILLLYFIKSFYLFFSADCTLATLPSTVPVLPFSVSVLPSSVFFLPSLWLSLASVVLPLPTIQRFQSSVFFWPFLLPISSHIGRHLLKSTLLCVHIHCRICVLCVHLCIHLHVQYM